VDVKSPLIHRAIQPDRYSAKPSAAGDSVRAVGRYRHTLRTVSGSTTRRITDLILERWDNEYRKLPWEAFGAHYLQMAGAMGGAACRAKGEPLSAYENARGTGNIHIWFDAEGSVA
jgi:hypothetical protein